MKLFLVWQTVLNDHVEKPTCFVVSEDWETAQESVKDFKTVAGMDDPNNEHQAGPGSAKLAVFFDFDLNIGKVAIKSDFEETFPDGMFYAMHKVNGYAHALCSSAYRAEILTRNMPTAEKPKFAQIPQVFVK